MTGVRTLDANIIPVFSCRICLTLTYRYAVGRHWPGLAAICLGGCSRFALALRPVRHFLVTVEYRQGLRGCSCCEHISTACLVLEVRSRASLLYSHAVISLCFVVQLKTCPNNCELATWYGQIAPLMLVN